MEIALSSAEASAGGCILRKNTRPLRLQRVDNRSVPMPVRMARAILNRTLVNVISVINSSLISQLTRMAGSAPTRIKESPKEVVGKDPLPAAKQRNAAGLSGR